LKLQSENRTTNLFIFAFGLQAAAIAWMSWLGESVVGPTYELHAAVERSYVKGEIPLSNLFLPEQIKLDDDVMSV